MLTSNYSIASLLDKQRQYFATGETKSVDFRLQQLKKLKSAIASRQDKILEALKADLGKPTFEGCFELAVLQDLTYAIKNLKNGLNPRK